MSPSARGRQASGVDLPTGGEARAAPASPPSGEGTAGSAGSPRPRPFGGEGTAASAGSPRPRPFGGEGTAGSAVSSSGLGSFATPLRPDPSVGSGFGALAAVRLGQ